MRVSRSESEMRVSRSESERRQSVGVKARGDSQ